MDSVIVLCYVCALCIVRVCVRIVHVVCVFCEFRIGGPMTVFFSWLILMRELSLDCISSCIALGCLEVAKKFEVGVLNQLPCNPNLG